MSVTTQGIVPGVFMTSMIRFNMDEVMNADPKDDFVGIKIVPTIHIQTDIISDKDLEGVYGAAKRAGHKIQFEESELTDD